MVKLKRILLLFLIGYVFILITRLKTILSGNIYLKQLGIAMNQGDMIGQEKILKLFSENGELNKNLNNFFKENSAKISDYLILINDVDLLKKYFNVLTVKDIDDNTKMLLLEKALAYGYLKIANELMDIGGVTPSYMLIINNFDSIAREKDLINIEKFVDIIKSKDMLSILLDIRDVFKEEKTLKALIHFVAQRCNLNWLNVLLREGVCINLEDFNKTNPFHEVVTTLLPDTLDNKVEFISTMIKARNADIMYCDREDKSALDLTNEYLVKYKKLYTETKSPYFKEYLKKTMNVYEQLKKIFETKMQRD